MIMKYFILVKDLSNANIVLRHSQEHSHYKCMRELTQVKSHISVNIALEGFFKKAAEMSMRELTLVKSPTNANTVQKHLRIMLQ